MRRRLIWSIVAVATAVPVSMSAAVLATPAQAATSTASAAAGVPSEGAGLAVTALPNSNITKSKTTGLAHYVPGKLAATWSGPLVGTPTCTAALFEITITNKYAVSETITLGGKVFGVIPAKSAVGVCFWGSGTHVFTYRLVGSKSKLAVTIT